MAWVDQNRALAWLGVSRSTLYRMVRDGKVESRKVGGTREYDIEGCAETGIDFSELISVSELAGIMGVSQQTVYRRVGRGDLPCVRVRGRIMFVPGDVLPWSTGVLERTFAEVYAVMLERLPEGELSEFVSELKLILGEIED